MGLGYQKCAIYHHLSIMETLEDIQLGYPLVSIYPKSFHVGISIYPYVGGMETPWQALIFALEESSSFFSRSEEFKLDVGFKYRAPLFLQVFLG